MPEYDNHLKSYKVYAWMHFSKLVREADWGQEKLAEEYLEKYWMPEQEYLTTWKDIQDSIFFRNKSLPEWVYRHEFDLVSLRGGCLFMEEDFKQLQKSIKEIGDNHIVVIQHSQDFTNGEPMFRMKFPVNITWEELISGNYISAVLLEMSFNEYFVFSESGGWGKYSANDNNPALDIIGFRSEFSSTFRKYLKQTQQEKEEIENWLPQEYKKRIR